MITLLGLLVSSAMVLASIGFGAALLRALDFEGERGFGETLVWAWAMGYGILGWLLFPIGVFGGFQVPVLAGLIGVGFVGLILLPRERASAPKGDLRLGRGEAILVGALAVVLALGVCQGMAPPADADTLAYHFALPKLFAEEQRIVFVPRALDGAIPLLTQLTYVPAIALGGERALTLWAMTTGWVAGAAVYVLCRRFLDRTWSLAGALIYLTTPGVVFGAGNGQVEVKMSLFVVLAVLALIDGGRRAAPVHGTLTGLALGFAMATKFTGLLLPVAFAPAILLSFRTLRIVAALALAAALAGGQWYLWNWLHTGDPVFPLLFGLVEYRDPALWSAAHRDSLAAMIATEFGVPKNLLWFVLYPFAATLSGLEAFEGSRTGVGPLVILLLPFVVMAMWTFRHRLLSIPLFIPASAALLYYALWFFLGASQRVRHLLPIYPLVLVCILAAAARWASSARQMRPFAAAITIVALVQVGGTFVFSMSYLRYLWSGEDRETFLERSVSLYAPLRWINRTLTEEDRILIPFRQLIYLTDPPVFYAHEHDEARIDISAAATDPERFYRQLRANDVSHLLVVDRPQAPVAPYGLDLWPNLVEAGCAETAAHLDATSIRSRTLAAGEGATVKLRILALTPGTCHFG